MNGMQRKNAKGQKRWMGALAVVAVTLLMACNMGGDNRTPHPPVNPAMSGTPAESDHTSTDTTDLKDGYGSGTTTGAGREDNTERPK